MYQTMRNLINGAKNLIRRVLLFLLYKIGGKMKISYYEDINGEEVFLQQITYKNDPVITFGALVTLYVNEKHVSFKISNIENFNGSKPTKVTLKKL